MSRLVEGSIPVWKKFIKKRYRRKWRFKVTVQRKDCTRLTRDDVRKHFSMELEIIALSSVFANAYI